MKSGGEGRRRYFSYLLSLQFLSVFDESGSTELKWFNVWYLSVTKEMKVGTVLYVHRLGV